MFLQEQAGIVTPLAQSFSAVRNPCAGFFEETLVHAEVDQIAFARNAFAVKDVELGFAERRGDFVLHDFCARA